MKWFGIELNNGVAEFEDDVYFNNLTTTTGTSVLVVAADGLVSKSSVVGGDITGITTASTSGITGGATTGAPSLSLNLNGMAGAVLASTDSLAFLDATDNTTKLETIDDIATLFAGTGITASSGVISVDATQPTIESIGTDGDALSILSDRMRMTNSSNFYPILDLYSTAEQPTGPAIVMRNQRTNGGGTIVEGVNNDYCGTIYFQGYNDSVSGVEVIEMARIDAQIADKVEANAAGKLNLRVAEYDGTLTSGLKLDGDTNANGEIDVTIGAGAASTTTIAGVLDVTGTTTAAGFTTTGTWTFDEFTSGTIGITTIQDSGTTFDDNDTSLMTAAAIANMTTGPITGITFQTDSGPGSLASYTGTGTAGFRLLGGDGIGLTNSGITMTAALDATLTTVTSITNNNLNLGIGEDAQITFNAGATPGFTYVSDGANRLVVTDTEWIPTNNFISLGSDSRRWKELWVEEIISTNAILAGASVNTTAVYPPGTAHNVAGSDLLVRGGNTTAGTTNNIAGGDLNIYGGQGKGSGAGGDIVFKTANAGGSGSSLNALATALTISDDLSATFAGTIVGDLTGDVTGNATSASTVATVTASAQPAIESIGTDGDTLAILADDINISNSTASKPVVNITNTNADATAGELRFNKDSASGSVNDVMGTISWYGTDDDDNTHERLAYMDAIITDAAHGSEASSLRFYVAENDATLTQGLLIAGQADEDGEVHVTIGAGTQSIVTIPGQLNIQGYYAMQATSSGAAIPDDRSIIFMENTATSGVGGNDDIIILPTPVLGKQVRIIVAAICELRSSTPASISINGGTGSNAESPLSAGTIVDCTCFNTTTWICTEIGADGGTDKLDPAA